MMERIQKTIITNNLAYKSVCIILSIVAFIFCLVFIGHGIASINVPIEVEYGEGVTEVLITRLTQGKLYTDPQNAPWTVCPYTPFFIWAASLLSKGKACFWSGRLLSLISGLAIVGMVFLGSLLKKEKTNKLCILGSLTGILILLSDTFYVGWSCLSRVDILGVALSLAAVLIADNLCNKQGDKTEQKQTIDKVKIIKILLCGFLCFLAIFTKHSLLAAIVAVFAALIINKNNRKLAFIFIGILGSVTAIVTAIINQNTDGWFVKGIYSYTSFFWIQEQFNMYMKAWFSAHYIVLLTSLVGVILTLKNKNYIWPIYWLCTTFTVFGCGRYGAYYNYFIEFLVANSILTGMAVNYLLKNTDTRETKSNVKNWGIGIFAVLLLAQILYIAPNTNYYFVGSLPTLAQTETLPLFQGNLAAKHLRMTEQLAALRSFSENKQGPILAENMGNYAVLGREVYLCDPPIFAALQQMKQWDPTQLEEMIKQGKFAFISLDSLDNNFRFHAEIMKKILENYKVEMFIEGEYLLVPKK